MPDQRTFRLRVVYRKAGRLAWLSHLEITRALERCVRRAGLPYAVSQGFSPHMKIAFGSALPVGVGGTAEIFDVYLQRYVNAAEACKALQTACVPDLGVLSCSYIEGRAPAASVAFPVSRYRARLSEPVESLDVPESITLVKKKGERELLVHDYLMGFVSCAGCDVEFSLEQKPTGSLRADVFLAHCLRCSDVSIQVESLTRIAQS